MEGFVNVFQYLPLFVIGLALVFRFCWFLEETDREYKEEQAKKAQEDVNKPAEQVEPEKSEEKKSSDDDEELRRRQFIFFHILNK